jgi:host factor-I protein
MTHELVKGQNARGEEPALETAEHNVQDVFLNHARRERMTVTIYLVSGVKLIGKIKSFDKFSVLFDAGHQDMLLFKHAISTISVSKQSKSESRSATPSPNDSLNRLSDER